MRKLIVAAMTSLDGVIQAPGGADEDRSGGFALGGWVWPYASDGDEVMGGLFSRPFELVLGRRTYDIFAGYWPTYDSDDFASLASRFNRTAKHVATHDPSRLQWRNSHALGADVAASLAALKREDGPDLVTQGSSDLVHQLLAGDVVDELVLLVFPILLGHGKRLFDGRARPSAFRLGNATPSATGLLTCRYRDPGDVRTGLPGRS